MFHGSSGGANASTSPPDRWKFNQIGQAFCSLITLYSGHCPQGVKEMLEGGGGGVGGWLVGDSTGCWERSRRCITLTRPSNNGALQTRCQGELIMS